MKIGIKELPDDFRVAISDDFRKQVFLKSKGASGDMDSLCKSMGYCRSSIFLLERGRSKRGRMFIGVGTLKKMSEISGVPIKDFERNVIGLKSRKTNLSFKLPVETSPDMASLVAHFMGDGHLNGRHSSYFNNSIEIIREVKECYRKSFSLEIEENPCKGGYELYFPSSVSKIVAVLGAPEGEKVSTEMKVPRWITDGDKETKRRFLRSFFDDEGSVIFNYPRRYIVFTLSKSQNLIESNKRFLDDIRRMLGSLGIETTKVSDWSKNKSGTVEHAFMISKFSSISRFQKEIGFESSEKTSKLKALLASYKQFKGVK